MKTILSLTLTWTALASMAAPTPALLQLRMRANETASYETWRSNLCAIAAHPGCCDEVWLSTGTGAPLLDWHRERAKVIARAADDLRKLGLAPSLQFQATIGHGDTFGTPEMFAAKNWTGWTGRKGYETKFCSCPRQPKFLAYIREVSRIYAPIGFKAVWIDDDLRYQNHRPADNGEGCIGCWCETCLSAFNHENNTTYTREELTAAVKTDKAVLARWRAFSIASLCGVARAIAEVFHAECPSTMMAFQHGNWEDAIHTVSAVLKTLHEISGHDVGYRPGGGSYYDLNPIEVIDKSLNTGCFRKGMGDPAWVCEWTPEIECAPRTYYSRSSQGVLLEGFTALMFGMNRISFFVSDTRKESAELYGDHHWKALADAAPVLHGYARAIDGCYAVGCGRCGWVPLRRIGVPILAGIGDSRGDCTPEEMKAEPELMPSQDVQALREKIDASHGKLPALVKSPFYGMMLPHTQANGTLQTVALVNLRIESQQNVRVLLRHLPDNVSRATWHEMRHPDIELPIERSSEGASVTIPAIAAWNAGYLGF